MNVELIIQNKSQSYKPLLEENITWSTERKNVPGKLNFTVIKDDVIDFQEGNPVTLKIDGINIFYGFIFTKKRDKENHVKVTAYDQLRYLKNKDTLVYTNKTASDLIKIIAANFNLQLGEIDNTEFVISSRIEDNTTLFDMIENALDLELTNKKKMYVFYDDFGKLTLKNIEKMKSNILIDDQTGENFDYTSTIDEQTYNQIKLIRENKESGKRDVYISKDSNHINDFGILQMTDTLSDGENGQFKSNALLSLYNAKTRNLKITNVLGNTSIRAGNTLAVNLKLGDINVNNFMLIETCVHTFKESYHTMNLTLRGGEFIA